MDVLTSVRRLRTCRARARRWLHGRRGRSYAVRGLAGAGSRCLGARSLSWCVALAGESRGLILPPLPEPRRPPSSCRAGDRDCEWSLGGRRRSATAGSPAMLRAHPSSPAGASESESCAALRRRHGFDRRHRAERRSATSTAAAPSAEPAFAASCRALRRAPVRSAAAAVANAHQPARSAWASTLSLQPAPSRPRSRLLPDSRAPCGTPRKRGSRIARRSPTFMPTHGNAPLWIDGNALSAGGTRRARPDRPRRRGRAEPLGLCGAVAARSASIDKLARGGARGQRGRRRLWQAGGGRPRRSRCRSTG